MEAGSRILTNLAFLRVVLAICMTVNCYVRSLTVFILRCWCCRSIIITKVHHGWDYVDVNQHFLIGHAKEYDQNSFT